MLKCLKEWSEHQVIRRKRTRDKEIGNSRRYQENIAIVTISFRAAKQNTQILKIRTQRHKPYTPDFGS